ncbi:MAG: type VI secretion system membrane subunit TssM [Gammaproteobacteria bacterium]|nr:type VI secretion system membrane subunit TssM [Gammaproteobacteria bacterium]
MNRLRNFFTNKWVLGLIGLLAFSLLIWFGTEYIKFGSDNTVLSATARISLIVFFAAIWLVWNLSQWLMERRQNRALLNEIEDSKDSVDDPDQERSEEELSALSKRFREAMEVLRKAKFKSERGNVSLYQLPWYIIIGPPGSGKTTALINSGLEFPLTQTHGNKALGGVGGTRSCDWWFTNDAVLIDTAGRYTTQDSHRVVDNSGWQAFLRLLKRYRRRRPINGVLVAISLQDLMVQTAEQRLQQAKTIRVRINELQQQLGIRFPIYLVFTKSDLVAGFSEFFDNLSQAEREQVWGVSFPAEESAVTGAALDSFTGEFQQLIDRLNQRVLWRVHQERDVEKRARLQGFPARMESMKVTLNDFIGQAFSANRYDIVPMMRGVYFTSGTQEGSPIDRMMASISADFGLERDMGKQFQGAGKSYFLQRLLKDVMFPEAELVGVNRQFESTMRWFRRSIFAVLATIFIAALALWTGSIAQNKLYMGKVDAYVAEFELAQAQVGNKRITPVESLKMLEPLQQASSIYDREEHLWLTNLGLYDERIDESADRIYLNQLQTVLLPALIRDVEHRLNRMSSDDAALPDTLKVYLMFFTPEKRELELFKKYFTKQWQQQLPGQLQQQEQLAGYLRALLQRPLPENLPKNERVVAKARRQLRRIPLPQRLYAQLKQSDMGATLVNLYGDIGGDIEQLFGVSASDARFLLPYLYTKAGYKEQDFSTDSLLMTKLSQGRWIYGGDISGERYTEEGRKKLEEEVKKLYLSEYYQRWDKFLKSFTIQRFRSTEQALDMLSKLSDPMYSPLLAVAEITAENTQLTLQPEVPVNDSGVALPVSSSARKVGNVAAKGVAGALQKHFEPNLVDLRFEPLQRMVRSEKGRPARAQEYLTAIGKVQEYLTEINTAPDANQAAFTSAKKRFSGGGDAIKQLRTLADSASAPFDQWLNEIADHTWALVMTKAKLHIDRVWREQVYADYRRSLANHYPLRGDQSQQAPVMEFNNYFKPGGIEQSFVMEYLKSFVDTRRWTLKSLEGQNIGLSPATLLQLKRAERIRNTFFGSGGQAGYSFRIEPTKLDSDVRLFALEMGEQRVVYSHGPRTMQTFTWRGGENNRVRVIFEDLNEAVHNKHFEGDWAWFQLLESSKLESGRNNTQHLVTFEEQGRKAQFKLVTTSVDNPFDRNLLRGYRCPEIL